MILLFVRSSSIRGCASHVTDTFREARGTRPPVCVSVPLVPFPFPFPIHVLPDVAGLPFLVPAWHVRSLPVLVSE
jgi:hypothetical protein